MFMKRFKLPSFTTFYSRNSTSPYEKFFFWVANQFDGIPKGKVINVTACLLHKEDYQKLHDQTHRWVKKQHDLDDKRAAKELAWLSLDISPGIVTDDLEFLFSPGYVYVKEKKLFQKQRK